ncbi:MAG: hypothetical protein RBU30_23385 [Polyangia bacterium]|jgi:hypothetical protein|nr:hypothetical protein [Polyangia bacterium]
MDPTNLTEMNRLWLTSMQDMFRQSMTAMTSFQEEVLRMAKVMGEKSNEAMGVNQALVDEWVATVRKGREEMRKMVDESFKRAQESLDSMRKTGAK